MQPRTTAILFVVFILFGAFIYLYEIEGEAGREVAAQESQRMFPGVDAEAVDILEFRTQDDRPFESVRTGDGWQIRIPVDFPGDAVNLDAIASTLANLKSETAIEAAGAPEIYGLGASAKKIRFRVGEQHYRLEIGADTPVGGNVYVRNPDAVDDPTYVYTVATFRISSFARDLDSLRDRRVLNFDRARVNGVVAGWPGGSVTLVLSEAGWEITHPKAIAGPADTKAVEDLLSDVAFLRAVGFVDAGDPGTAGGEEQARDGAGDETAEPYYTLRIGLDPEIDAGPDTEESSQARVRPLEVSFRVLGDAAGATDADEYRVRTGHTDVLYRVPRSRIDRLPREQFAFRFKELSNFETVDVQSFELSFSVHDDTRSAEPVSVRVDRVATGWKAVGDTWVPGAAAGLIAEFARLEAISVAADNPDEDSLTALGLFPPQTILRAYGAPADPQAISDARQLNDDEQGTHPEADDEAAREAPRVLLAEVSLGTLDPAAGIAAKALGQAIVYRLDSALAEQIPVSLEAYRNRFLILPGEDGDQAAETIDALEPEEAQAE